MTKTGDIDNIALRVELPPEFRGETKSIEDSLEQELRDKTNLRFDLEFCPPGSLPRYATKARRFKDLRGKE